MRRLRDTIRRITSNSEGFTLLEVLVSTAVFAVGILGVAALQLNAVGNNTLAEDVQQNTTVAMDQVEGLMATDYLDQRIAFALPTCTDTDDGNHRICAEPSELVLPGAKRVEVTSQFIQNGVTKTVTMRIFKPFIK